MILTKKSNIETRVQTVYQAWASKCDDYIFVTAIPEQYHNGSFESNKNERIETRINNLRFLQPKGVNETTDVYENLTVKVLSAFQDLYNTNFRYDWFLKADDDTFLLMDNLRDFLKDKDPRWPITYGYGFDDTYVENGYNSGGAGYLLSKEALGRLGSKLNQNGTFCLDWGIEDLDVGRCLRRLEVNLGDTIDSENKERFHFANVFTHFYREFTERNWKHILPKYPIRKVSNIFLLCLVFNYFCVEFFKGNNCFSLI